MSFGARLCYCYARILHFLGSSGSLPVSLPIPNAAAYELDTILYLLPQIPKKFLIIGVVNNTYTRLDCNTRTVQ